MTHRAMELRDLQRMFGMQPTDRSVPHNLGADHLQRATAPLDLPLQRGGEQNGQCER